MQYQYALSERLAVQVSSFEEFANGAAQCYAVLDDGPRYVGILISNATAIVAMRGHVALPFSIDSIKSLYQVGDDGSPVNRGGWTYFDKQTKRILSCTLQRVYGEQVDPHVLGFTQNQAVHSTDGGHLRRFGVDQLMRRQTQA
nr:hypothetical protein [uncultured Rhodoferax sp.]